MSDFVMDDNPHLPKEEMLRIVNLEHLEEHFPHERQSIIDGLIRTGSVMNIIAAPKIGKSFLTSNMAMCLITGKPFLGFPIARQGKTLVVDNELHKETISQRYRTTRHAFNVPASQRHMIDVLSLRGIPCDIPMLKKHLAGTKPGEYSAIILDAFYKLIPSGISENDNASMGGVYTQLDSIAEELDTAIVVIHHSSKGFQGDKALSDIGSGAGVISRSVDAHVVIRPHEQPGHCVFEALVRSFRQPEPRTIKFDYPIWSLVEMEAVVAQPKTPAASKRESEFADHDRIVRDYLTDKREPQTEAAIIAATGLSKSKVEKTLHRIGAHIVDTETNRWGKGVCKWGLEEGPPVNFSSDKVHNGQEFVF